MFGCTERWEGVEEDDEEDDEFLAGGGEGSLRRLGVCGEDLEGRRPLFEDRGSMLLAAGEEKAAGSAVCDGDTSVMKESSSEGKSSNSDMTARRRSPMLRN